jgi:3-oxoacyl-[acyl-carrier protein] reductase
LIKGDFMAKHDKKVALVSGGSRGIGQAVVQRLVQDGFDVAFCYQSSESLAKQVEDEADRQGGRAVATRLDVTDVDAVRDWVAWVEREMGGIEAVVTSSGIIRDSSLVMMKDADWHAVLDTNLTGTYNVCRAAVFGMLKRRAGCVVTVSSVAGVEGNATQVNYSASKAGIIGFSRALAKEVGRYGIRVNAVAPGYIDTDMTAGLSAKTREQALAKVLLGRFGTAEEVAEAVSYLVRAGYITGTVLRIDGGLTG